MRPADQAKAVAVVGEGGIQLAGLQGNAELLQQRGEFDLCRLLLQLEDRDAIEQRVEGGASLRSRAGGGGSHQLSQRRSNEAQASDLRLSIVAR